MHLLSFPTRFLPVCSRRPGWWLSALLLACAATTEAAPVVGKVEPPNWWVGHSRHSLQVLLTGTGLENVHAASPTSRIEITSQQASTNGHYLFLYLEIRPDAPPGRHHFTLAGPDGDQGGFDLPLERRPDPAGRAQGFGPGDVIYLLMPDRFAQGGAATNRPAEPGPNSPAATEPAPTGGGRRGGRGGGGPSYHGGNLAGIQEHLDYLQELGVTGLWMTPIYQNSGPGRRGAYHGYSTTDYYAVEPHFGTLADLQSLVAAAHHRGLKIVQDQVANHCGPEHPWVKDPPTPTWFNNPVTRPRNNFDINALADPYARPSRRAVPVRGWFAGSLPDLNQDDPLVRDYEIQNALWWVGVAGLDGIRQDTYPYVDRAFWEVWQTALDAEYPRLGCVAEITASTPAVLSFFEGGVRREGHDTHLRAALDFPLHQATQRVFGTNAPLTDLVAVLAQDSLFLHPERLVTFMGNHDEPRIATIAKGDLGNLLLAATFTLTTRRTVHLYYGEELGLRNGPGSGDATYRVNFPGGFPGDTNNAFLPAGRTGETAQVYDWTRSLLHFRLAHPALRGGGMVNLLTQRDRYAYLRRTADEEVLVVLNRAGATPALSLDLGDLDLPAGLRFTSFPPDRPDLTLTAEGRLVIPEPHPIELYWAARPGGPR